MHICHSLVSFVSDRCKQPFNSVFGTCPQACKWPQCNSTSGFSSWFYVSALYFRSSYDTSGWALQVWFYWHVSLVPRQTNSRSCHGEKNVITWHLSFKTNQNIEMLKVYQPKAEKYFLLQTLDLKEEHTWFCKFSDVILWRIMWVQLSSITEVSRSSASYIYYRLSYKKLHISIFTGSQSGCANRFVQPCDSVPVCWCQLSFDWPS